MITAYVKPTNFCNVGCDHCYLTLDVRADKSRMSEQVLRETAAMLSHMAAAGRHDSVMVLWHGGEPLTMPLEWFERAGQVLDEMLPNHTQAIQTSLIPFTEKWVPWVKNRLGSFIGSSIDFHSRTLKGSAQAYQELWMQKVDLARSHDIYVVPGMVPTTKDLQRAGQINQWFIDRGLLEYNIERYNQFGMELPDWPTNAQHSQFLIELFSDVMVRISLGQSKIPLVRVLAAAIGGVLYDAPGDRWGGSCQSDFVVVEPDGGLNNCTDKTSFERPYSNVSQGWSGFSLSPERRRWIRIQAVDHRKDHCMVCENRSWCKSGCPITPNGPSDGQQECAGYKMFIDYVRDFVSTDSGLKMARDYHAYCFSHAQGKFNPYGDGRCQVAA